MDILLLFILIYASKHAWDDSKSAWGKSRSSYMKNAKARFPDMPKSKRTGHAVRHDLGYALSQLLHGFPQARHGFGAGWHQGRQAHAQARAERERAKTDHLETRARLMPDLRDYRRRQKEALDQIRAGEPWSSVPHPEPETQEEDQPTRRVDGKPETEADKRFFDARETGYKGWINQDGVPVPDPSDPDPARNQYPPGEGSADDGEGSPDDTSPGPETTPSQPTTEGSNGMSDTTYDSVIKQMESVRDAEENSLADRKSSTQQANSAADDMQALNVDPATLSAMADHLDAHQDAEKAQQKVMETAESVKDALQRGHQGLSDAHKDAPVTAADRPFYEE